MTALRTTTRITKTPKLSSERTTSSKRLVLDTTSLNSYFVADNSYKSPVNKERYQNQAKFRRINPAKGKNRGFRRLTSGSVL